MDQINKTIEFWRKRGVYLTREEVKFLDDEYKALVQWYKDRGMWPKCYKKEILCTILD